MATTPDVKAALRERYCKPEWAYFEEVANTTGVGGNRYADAVALNLYPSRGLTLNGFEIKVSRSDWLRELKKPDKAEQSIVKYCDHWYVVTLPDIVKEGELPSTWGLILYKDGKLREAVKAPKLEAKSLDRGFIAALLRRANEIDKETIDSLVNAAYCKERDRLQAEYDRRSTESNRKYRDLVNNLNKVKEETGIDLLNYHPPEEVVALIKAIKQADITSNYRGLTSLCKTIGDMHSKLTAAIGDVPLVAEIIAADKSASSNKWAS